MKPVRKRTRLIGWDYGSDGAYFLTLCAKDRKSVFSHIVGHGILDAPEVQLSEYGVYIQNALMFLAEKHPEMVMHHWVIMPNHVHILMSIQQKCEPVGGASGMPCPTVEEESAGGASGMPRPTDAAIPKLISSLKRFTNRKAGFQLWQNGCYDHIIRDETDFIRGWNYIDNNPASWLDDDYYINELLEVK